MTQNEFNFIREACITKINKLLDGIVADADELHNFREEAKQKEEKKAQKKIAGQTKETK